MSKAFFFSLGLFFSLPLWGAPSSMIVEGQLTDATGLVPIEGATVDFKLQVWSPGQGCLLYEESHILDMSESSGYFNLKLGSGSRTASANFHDTSSLQSAFSNHTGMVTPTTCNSGSTYTPAINDHRDLVIMFNENSSGWQTVAQAIEIYSNAYAHSASTIDGFSHSDFLKVNTTGSNVATQANLDWLFDSTRYTELQSLINGTSNNYVTTSANGTSKLPSLSSAPGSPAAGDLWYNSTTNTVEFYDGTSTQTVGAGGGAGVSTFNGRSGAVIANAGDYDSTQISTTAYNGIPAGSVQDGLEYLEDNKLSTSGTIPMSGNLDLASNNIVNVNDISVDNNVTINGGLSSANGFNTNGAIGVGTSTPVRAIHVTNSPIRIDPLSLSSGSAGDLAFDISDSNKLKYHNGSSWVEPGTGEVNSAVNVGSGYQIFSSKVGNDIQLRSLSSISPSLSITQNSNELNFSIVESSFDPNLINVGTTPLAATNLNAAIIELDTNKLNSSTMINTSEGIIGGGPLSGGPLNLQVDINGLPSLTGGIMNDDEFMVFDNSMGLNKKVTRHDFLTPIDNSSFGDGSMSIGLLNSNWLNFVVNGNNKLIMNNTRAYFPDIPLGMGTNTPQANIEIKGTLGAPGGAFKITKGDGSQTYFHVLDELYDGEVGIGTTAALNTQLTISSTGATKLLSLRNSASTEVAHINEQGDFKGHTMALENGNSLLCNASNMIGKIRWFASQRKYQVCIQDNNANYEWYDMSKDFNQCPSGWDRIGQSGAQGSMCISPNQTSDFNSGANHCYGQNPKAKFCTHQQLAYAKQALPALAITTGTITNNIVHNGALNAITVDVNGLPLNLEAPATSGTIRCCID